MSTQHRSSALDPSGLPDVAIQGAHLAVQLPRYFRDSAWAHGMGAVQDKIAEHASSARGAARQLTFDLAGCRWIDPLPLMSILIEIEHAVSLGMRVRVELPEADDGSDDSEIGSGQTSPNRLLRFLDTEGFLDHLERLARSSDKVEYPQLGRRQDYPHLQVMPSYEDSRCLPMKLLRVPIVKDGPEFAQQAVELLLAGIDTRLDARISPQTRDRLKYKLDVALNEAISNVQQHAYEEGTAPRLLVVYVRYRAGGVRLDAASRAMFEAYARDERAHCPGIDPSWLAERPGGLEVFVLDRGMGMVRSFESAQRSWTNTSRFGDVMTATLRGGDRSKPRQTRHGGLRLLHHLMADTGDYVRMLDDGAWFACKTPLPTWENRTEPLIKAWAKMRGLAMHLRLGWKAEVEEDLGWTKFEESETGELWQELSLDEKACVTSMGWFSQQAVIDERFGQLPPERVTRSEWMLWLVRPHRMKSDILSFLKETVASHACEEARLVIADIPSHEAETYAAALAELKLSRDEQWPSLFASVVLCTNRWRFAAVEYVSCEAHHGYSILRKDVGKKQMGAPPIEPQPRDFRFAVVRWLKWHDSRIVWARVNRHRSMFIPQKIAWGLDCSSGKPQIISGYIDFAQTARDKLCAVIYRSALARVLGVMDLGSVRMSALDQQTTALLLSIHAPEVRGPARRPPSIQLNLGSVLVSGSTLEGAAPYNLDLHFFIHSSSKSRGEKPCLLFWLPLHDVDPGRPRLARIGKTATIGPDGWKSFEIPRYDRERRSLGERDPQNTYKDWQSPSPVIVKAGHWSYQGHHDFLTVNTAGAVEAAFFEKNDLARFLVSRILPFLGLTRAHVQTAWHCLWSSPALEESPKEQHADYGLLVYRSHPSSESIIGKLLEVLTEVGREIALQRVFPILPVRMQPSGSALLIPPLVREEIRVALNRDKRSHRVRIFDDAAVSGRTLNDLRAALSAIGATHISNLVITNRLRQPADVNGDMQLQYFWRLDLPIMGREGNCPLCHALDLVQRFSTMLASKKAKEEIEEWLQRWDSVSPLDHWSRGLRPLPLRLPDRRKGYCYRQEAGDRGDFLAEIDLVRSTGLAIHVSELHAMTGRDDYCLRKIEQHDDPEVRVELAASQLLLFGNEFDIHARVALTKVLVRELARLETSSPHVQLGCLVAMASLTQVGPDARKQVVASIAAENLAGHTNYAIKIMLAYLVPPGLREPSADAEIIGLRLLSTAPLSVSGKLRALFLATLSPLGNPHSQALPTLLDELERNGATTEGAVRDARDSLDRIEELIIGLERLLVRLDARSWYANGVVTWKQTTRSMMQLLDADWTMRVGQIVVALESYLHDTRRLADAYFHRIDSAQKYYLNRTFETEALSKLIAEIDWGRASVNKWTATGQPVGGGERQIRISAAGRIDFDSNAGEVWIAWHQGVPEIVSDLMKNAVHASAAMFDHWNHTSRGVAHLWVRVDYGRQHVALTMVNLCDRDPKDIHSRLKSERWAALREIGGAVEPIDVGPDRMGMEVRIPYAAHLELMTAGLA